jgi:uncharacterized RDD family membrane protein YckC
MPGAPRQLPDAEYLRAIADDVEAADAVIVLISDDLYEAGEAVESVIAELDIARSHGTEIVPIKLESGTPATPTSLPPKLMELFGSEALALSDVRFEDTMRNLESVLHAFVDSGEGSRGMSDGDFVDEDGDGIHDAPIHPLMPTTTARVLATLVDAAGLIAAIIAVLLSSAGRLVPAWVLEVGMTCWFLCFIPALSPDGRKGSTLGKRLVGIAVRSTDGGRPTAASCVKRETLKYLWAIPSEALIGAVMAGFESSTYPTLADDTLKGGGTLFHDRVAGTMVRRADVGPVSHG